MTRLRRLAALGPLAGFLLLGACAEPFDAPSEGETGATEAVNAIDAAGLNDLMLTVSDPETAVSYFRRALDETPERADLRRGYVLALARARRFAEAVEVFEGLEADGLADDALRVEYAHSLARLARWEEAANQLALVSSSLDTPRRHLIDAMLADQRQDWAGADAAYEAARRRAVNPGAVLNNWGVSRLSRGDAAAAARTFEEALSFDPRLFNAKNNLAVARALEGEYSLPLVSLSEEERATLLHNVGVVALRRGDVEAAKGLFSMAVAAHPRFYPEAAEKLAALQASVSN
ncbi:MAG: tetratricopeptide repeat protein [Pikeienuella sp.]|uniref:tetratricopeptide repeat protein n=1 Tax=Pikeienuella sp. TaxID=2831957 RepID=UPI00391D78B5